MMKLPRKKRYQTKEMKREVVWDQTPVMEAKEIYLMMKITTMMGCLEIYLKYKVTKE
jgi:hypothetical protein